MNKEQQEILLLKRQLHFAVIRLKELRLYVAGHNDFLFDYISEVLRRINKIHIDYEKKQRS